MLYKIKYFVLEDEELIKYTIQANNFVHCTGFLIDYLDNRYGEENWEILEIKTDFNFIDAVHNENHFSWEPKEIECPSCSIEHTELDRIMNLECQKCSNKIRVSDNGWTSITCPQCNTIIVREYLFRNPETGEWEYNEMYENE